MKLMKLATKVLNWAIDDEIGCFLTKNGLSCDNWGTKSVNSVRQMKLLMILMMMQVIRRQVAGKRTLRIVVSGS
jgi:hypothetical protein